MSQKENYTTIEIIAIISELIAIFCLIAYFFVLFYFLKHAIFRRDLFYWLLIHLGVTDVIFLMLYIFYGGPKTFAGAYAKIPKAAETFLGFINSITMVLCLNVVPVEISFKVPSLRKISRNT